MKMAFIVYDQLTLLDLVGFYDPISRLKTMSFLPNLSWDFCGNEIDIKDNFGFPIQVDYVRNNLSKYDMIFVPGGYGTRKLMNDASFITWLKTARDIKLKTAVCSGSLLLGAAGFLTNKKATTHFEEYEALALTGAKVIKENVVEDQGIITAGAVASSLNLGLYICEKLAGGSARKAISTRMGLSSEFY